jgi:hypothetical protein
MVTIERALAEGLVSRCVDKRVTEYRRTVFIP